MPSTHIFFAVQIDTGSSSLAFCNSNLVNDVDGISKLNYVQCAQYGGLTPCSDDEDAPSGSFIVWAGSL